jgi:hypothetical protein
MVTSDAVDIDRCGCRCMTLTAGLDGTEVMILSTGLEMEALGVMLPVLFENIDMLCCMS